MGIYLPNMEMPQSCKECKFWTITSCTATFQGEKSCPLIEVQEPHGRLGDLTAIEAQLDYIANLDWNKQVGASGGMLAALEVVEDAPTIIPADESDMDSFIRVLEEDDEEDWMDSFIRILKD